MKIFLKTVDYLPKIYCSTGGWELVYEYISSAQVLTEEGEFPPHRLLLYFFQFQMEPQANNVDSHS
jgi:hypothetical protein